MAMRSHLQAVSLRQDLELVPVVLMTDTLRHTRVV